MHLLHISIDDQSIDSCYVCYRVFVLRLNIFLIKTCILHISMINSCVLTKTVGLIVHDFLLQVMFEKYQFHGLYIAIQAVLTLYAQGNIIRFL